MHPAHFPEPSSNLGERYRVLLDIGRTLAATLSLDELFRVLYHETARVLEATGFYVTLYDDSRDLATVVFYADQGEEHRSEIVHPASESEAIRTARACIVRDRTQIDSLLILGEEADSVTRSAISTPMLHNGRILGSISAQSYRVDAYTDADLELLQGIADIAAVAIENAHYVAELDRRKSESDRIEEMGRTLTGSLDTDEVLSKVIEAVLALLKADSSSVWLLDDLVARVAASGGARPLPQGLRWNVEGHLHERLVKEGGSVLFEELDRDPTVPESLRKHLQGGAGVVVPMSLENEVIGALTAECQDGRTFTVEDRGLLERLARQTAVALENAELHKSLQALSLTDPLTGLPNRRHLEIHLAREVAAAQRGRDLVVVIFDLDNFKQYNDTRGHLAGDEVLRTFGAILVDENRAMNLVARMGGDEFVSVLTETTSTGARAYVDRIHRRVAEDELLSSGGITTSSGMAPFRPSSMKRGRDVLRAADSALYDEKALKGPTRG